MLHTQSFLPHAKLLIQLLSDGSCSMELILTAGVSLPCGPKEGDIQELRLTTCWEHTSATKMPSTNQSSSYETRAASLDMTSRVSSPPFAEIPIQLRSCCVQIILLSREDIRLLTLEPRRAGCSL